MSVYDVKDLSVELQNNAYPGRGIVIGKTADSKFAVAMYFIMGRSANSRNRVFVMDAEGNVETRPFDESKVEDPSLIIYTAVQKNGNNLIVTNGDQTTTIHEFLNEGKTFEEALDTREFEPDAPNLTPRISGMMTFADGDFTYKMSILKSGDADGTYCNRFTFDYNHATPGVAHFIHTYGGDGNPLPTFTGEPERVSLKAFQYDIDRSTTEVWNSLNPENRISLFVRYIDLQTGEEKTRIVNKYC